MADIHYLQVWEVRGWAIYPVEILTLDHTAERLQVRVVGPKAYSQGADFRPLLVGDEIVASNSRIFPIFSEAVLHCLKFDLEAARAIMAENEARIVSLQRQQADLKLQAAAVEKMMADFTVVK